MANIYEVTLPSGKVVEIESDSPPTPQDEQSLISSLEPQKKPFMYRDDSGVLRIGENLLDLSEGTAGRAALRAGVSEIPGSAAGAAAFGAAASNPMVQKLPPALRIGIPLVAGMAGGLTGTMATRGAIRGTMPELAQQLGADAAAHPNAVAAGSVLAQAPFFRPGAGLRLPERAIGGAIGAGIAGGAELMSDAPVDADMAARVAMAGVGNMVFTDPTKLGRGAMNLGASVNKKPITSQLGNASTKDTVVENLAASNDIALATPTQATIESDLIRPLANPAVDSAQALSGLMPQQQASGTMLADLLSNPQSPGDLSGFSPIEPSGPLNFGELTPGAPRKAPKAESPEPTKPRLDFNARVKSVTENLKAEGVELDRQTAVKLALVGDPQEFNLARQKLIDSVRGDVAVIPKTGPIKSLDALPAKMGADDAVMPDAAVEPVKPEPSPVPEETHTSTVVKTKPEPQKLEFVGVQEGIPDDSKFPSIELWNISKDIVDPAGKVLHPKGSTVSRTTLEGYGLKVPQATKPAKPKRPVAPGEPIMGGFGSDRYSPAKAPEVAPAAPEAPLKKSYTIDEDGFPMVKDDTGSFRRMNESEAVALLKQEKKPKRVSIDDIDAIDKAAEDQNKLGFAAQPLMSTGEPIIGAAAGYLTGDTPEDRKERAKKGFAIGAAVSLGGRFARGKLTMTPKGLQNLGMTAYHGTPHKVDKFSKSKIGTGEGAQVYGHGLYFAENKAVAESYAQKLAEGFVRVDGKEMEVPANWGSRTPEQHALYDLSTIGYETAKFTPYGHGEEGVRYLETLEKYKNSKVEGGNLYEVDVDLKPDNTLDWDKPLSEQHQSVRDKLMDSGLIPEEYFRAKKNSMGDRMGSEIYHALAQKLSVKTDFGIKGLEWQGEVPSPQKASEVLESLGIKGIAYADQGSRGKTEGTKNYVVFDDSLIKIKKENDKPVNPMSSERGSVINPFDGEMLPISKKALDAANEPLLQKMAKTDVENTNPLLKPDDPMASYLGSKDKPVEEPKAPERELDWADQIYAKASKHIDPKKIKKRLVEAEETGRSEPMGDEVAEAIAKAPEEYVPFLTNLAEQFPALGKIPGIRTGAQFIGSVSKEVRKAIGTIKGNVRDVSPRIAGALDEKVFERNKQLLGWVGRAADSKTGLGALDRKYLTRQEFAQVEAAKLSGDRERVLAIYNAKPQAKELIAALDNHQKVMQEALAAERESGRETGEVDFYFHRKLVDRDGLRKFLGKDESSVVEDALNAARKDGKVLSEEDEDKILNNLILGSMRNAGKPGYLKPRTIEAIEDNMLKFYEPTDVSTIDYLTKVTRDVSNRKWFGKTAEDGTPFEGNFGKMIQEEHRSGRVRDRGREMLRKNLGDYFTHNSRYEEDLTKWASRARKVQTYGYLADAANAIIQGAEVFTHLWRYGPKAALGSVAGKGPKINLEDINIYEGGNQDMLGLRRNPKADASLTRKIISQTEAWYAGSMKRFIGKADQIMTGVGARAAYRWANDIVNKPDSAAFKKLNAEYSKAFPEKWPEILKDLRSDDFRNGKLSDNAKLFLFSEVANLKPLDAAQRAQGYNSASPWGKLLYSLRTYPIHQLDVMRKFGYEQIKRGNAAEGFGALGSYILMVGAGQQTINYVRDKALNREQELEDYAITGMLQLALIPRYAVMTANQEGWGSSILKTAVPGVALVDDFGKDLVLTNRWVRGTRHEPTGEKSVRDLEDLFKQARTTQYAPAIGREVYWWAGRGSENEKRRERDRQEGRALPTIADTIGEVFNPSPLNAPRRQ